MRVFLFTVSALQSRSLLGLLLVLWLLAIGLYPLYISPSSDDGAYISEGLGFVNFGNVSLLHIETPLPFFLALPSYSMFEGLFLRAWMAVDLPFNYFTYNVFHQLTVVGLLFSALWLLSRAAPSAQSFHLRANIFLAALGVSPFVLDMPHQRPEPAGMALLLLGIGVAGSGLSDASGRLWRFATGGLLIGLAATFHPTFVVASAVVGAGLLLLLVLRGRVLASAVGLVGAAVPPMLVLAWYQLHAPVSFEMLFHHVGQRSPAADAIGVSYVRIWEYATMQAGGLVGLAVKAYWAICFAVLLFSTVVGLALLLRLFSAYRHRGGDSRLDLMMLCGCLLLGVCLNTLIDLSSRVQIYTVHAVAAILAMAVLLPAARADLASSTVVASVPGRLVAATVALLCVLAVLFNPITHVSKQILFSTPRYDAMVASRLVRSVLQPGDALFFTSDRHLPAFVDLVAETYAGEARFPAHWVLPFVHGSRAYEAKTVDAFVCFVTRRASAPVVWGLDAKYVEPVSGQPAVSTIRIDTSHRLLAVDFARSETIYEFFDGVFVRGVVQSIREVRGYDGRESGALLYPAAENAACGS